MAGPISTAFVDIVARFRVEQGGDLEKALKSQIRDLEGELSRLEGAAGTAGRAIARQLGAARINLDVRGAISDMQKVEAATGDVVGELRDLQSLSPKFQTGKATQDIRRLEDNMRELGRSLQLVDGEEIDLDVADATRQLRNIERAAVRLSEEFSSIQDIRFRPQVEAAVGDLERLQATVGEALTGLERIDQKRVRVNVDDLELERIKEEVDRLAAGTETIKIKVQETGLSTVSKGVDRLHVSVEDLGDQFRNIAFRAASFLAVGQAFSAFQRIISFGIEAAGQIQTVTVSLNRLFADMTQLGSTASGFIGDLRQVAIKTPFEFIDLADTSRRLVQLGGDADTALERMNALADAGAAVGATSEDINGVVRALSQLKAKGRINLQDLNQVAERLPNFQRTLQLQGVIDELKDMGSPLADTVHSFDDLRQAGVGIDTVINGIFRGLEEIPGAAGAAAAQAQTLQGALSNLKDFAQIEFSDAFRNAGVTLAKELNSAFSQVGDTAEETTSTMADGFKEVISAFGIGLDDALPEVIDFAGEVSDEFGNLADSIGNLVESLASGFAGDVFQGITDGLTGIINLATAANEIFSALPKSVSAGIGQVGTQIIALTRLGVPAFKPFQTLINDMILSFKLAQTAGENLAVGTFRRISTEAVAGAAAAAAGLAALTIVTNTLADASRRAREVAQSINEATRALTEFNDVGEAAVSFLDEFREKGEGINIGGLEKFLDGLTTTQLEDQLGLDADAMGQLVTEIAKLGDVQDFEKPHSILEAGDRLDFSTQLERNGQAASEMEDALGRVGLTLDDVISASDDAGFNLLALGDQFRQAAEASVKVGIATKRFGFVSDSTAQSILEAAEATGDWVTAQQRLNDANIAGARNQFGGLADQLNLTDAAQRRVILNNTDLVTGTIDWVGATGQLKEQLIEVDQAMLDLTERAPDLLKLSHSFDKAASVGKGFRESLVDFSVAAVDADLSAQELDAIVRDLGSSLTGEELKVKFEEISTAVEEMATSIEAVLPGFGDLQFEADSFSLDAFISELEKIGEARTKVVGNVNALLDDFGKLGADAVTALVDSGLNGEQFAVAIQGLVDGGKGKLEELVGAFGTIGQDASEELARRLIAAGITEEDAKLIAGVDHFETAAEQAGDAALEGLKKSGFFSADPGKLFAKGSIFDLSLQEAGGAAEVPSIDVEAATASADTAGDQIGAALAESVHASTDAGFLEVSSAVGASVAALGPSAGASALSAGNEIGDQLVLGMVIAVGALGGAVKSQVGLLGVAALPAASAAGKLMGLGLASSFGQSAREGLNPAFANLRNEFDAFGGQAEESLRSIGTLTGFTLVDSFDVQVSTLSDRMRAELDETLDALVAGSAPLKLLAAATGASMTVAFSRSLRLSDAVAREVAGASRQLAATGALANGAFRSGFNIGISFGRGISSGIRSSIAFSLAAAVQLVQATFAAVERAAGIASPSKLFATAGRQMGLGAAEGLLTALPQMRRAAGALVGAGALGAVQGPSLGGLVPSGSAASGVVRRLEAGPSAPSRQLVAASPAGGVVHHHTHHWEITAPTDDPEALARKVAVRIERDLDG